VVSVEWTGANQHGQRCLMQQSRSGVVLTAMLVCIDESSSERQQPSISLCTAGDPSNRQPDEPHRHVERRAHGLRAARARTAAAAPAAVRRHGAARAGVLAQDGRLVAHARAAAVAGETQRVAAGDNWAKGYDPNPLQERPGDGGKVRREDGV
jgi:hypothetical protein